ncbi:MAG: hypothetical protein AAFQ43_07705 [Bacteroidota bacterium]
MMRHALVLAATVLLIGCGSSPPEAPPTILGAWEGEGAQWDDGDRSQPPSGRWPLRVRVLASASGDLAATVEYPSFPCSGTLRYVGSSTEPDARPGDVIFLEDIQIGDDICVSGGTVLLRLDGDELVFAWAIDGAPTTASARLSREE